jgi:O-succinylhomoserine sulfhydrylase
MTDELKDAGFDTRAVRYAQERTGEHEHSEPIFTTSSFVFDSAAHAAAVFSGDEPGNIYARFNNPTVRTFEQRLASLEGGECCVATSSGMSAILSTVMALLQSGDHLIASKSLFGSTIGLFDNYLKKFGVEVSYVTLSDNNEWANAITSKTRMLFVETPSNPLTEVGDIQALADIAHAADALLVVDNCFCTPALQRPFELGADIVIHSATKYLDGQGRAVGGAVVGNKDDVGDKVFSFLRTAGPTMSPFNAWIFTRGLETLSLRMKAHCETARQLADWLQQHKNVARVYYPGLEDHPQYDLARRQQSDSGGIVAFDIAGGREAAWRVVDRLKIMSITANLGDVKTTITHPSTTTHHRISAEQRAAAGIGDGLLRISAGLESFNDLIGDLEQALR